MAPYLYIRVQFGPLTLKSVNVVSYIFKQPHLSPFHLIFINDIYFSLLASDVNYFYTRGSDVNYFYTCGILCGVCLLARSTKFQKTFQIFAFILVSNPSYINAVQRNLPLSHFTIHVKYCIHVYYQVTINCIFIFYVLYVLFLFFKSNKQVSFFSLFFYQLPL